jgi:TolB-like protein
MSLVAELRRRNVVRVAAAYLVVGWLLTEVLTTILPTLGAPEWTSRAVILIFAFGFIPAVVFSWFYELTPEGIKREADILGEEKVKTRAGKMLDYITVTGVVVLIVFVGLFSAQQAGDDALLGGTEVSVASVAVLPFVNMSNDDDNEYFSDGLTETLLHMLTQIPDLKVAARTSSFAFKGQNKSIQEIAAALGVAHILEGSVQRAGDNVRITAQLIRASDGFHVWSSNYDRTLENIFAIQDEIAQKVGFELSESLLGATDQQLAGVQTTNPDAYDLYLQARRERATFSYGGLKAAEDLLKGALLIDPDFVEAKTELASSYIHQWETGLMDLDDTSSEVMAITEQVLAARPDDVVARALRTYVDATGRAIEGDARAIRPAIAELESLVAEAPEEIDARILLVRAYTHVLEHERAASILEEARTLDPFNPQLHYELGRTYRRLERYEDASASLEKSLEIEPAQPNAYTDLGGISLHNGDGVGYVKNYLKSVEVDPRDHELPGLLAAFLYRLELIEEGDDFRDRVATIAPTSEVAYRLELLRAMQIDDAVASDASARRIILNDIEDRRFGFGGAVQYLLRAAVRNGTVDEEIAWLEENAPGIFDFEAESVPPKYRKAQGIAYDAWAATLPREELVRRVDIMIGHGKSASVDYTQEPYTNLAILALRGEIQEAVQFALDSVFSRSVATNLGWKETFAQAQYAEIVTNPRIQAAMQRWEDEEDALRGEVQAYLADLQAAT